MWGLSKKEVENYPTRLAKVSNAALFNTNDNQRYLTKKIYYLHKSSNGSRNYLHFRDIIPQRMFNWAIYKNINEYETLAYDSTNILKYLNKEFISTNRDLYELHNNISQVALDYDALDSNVYRDSLYISYAAEEGLDGKYYNILRKKNPSEMLVEDIRNMDVWSEQTTEINNNMKRYGNTVPAWQKSMHVRNYDRDNQGYHHANPSRASIENQLHGYGDEMKKLSIMAEQRLKKYYKKH